MNIEKNCILEANKGSFGYYSQQYWELWTIMLHNQSDHNLHSAAEENMLGGRKVLRIFWSHW